MKDLSKSHKLFGKAKSKSLTATAKQEIRDAHEAVLECVEDMMALAEKIDRMAGTVDNAMLLLHTYHTNAEQKHIFVPSKL